jgi:hypothetical protein
VISGIGALLISLPQNFTPHIYGRLVGESIEDRIDGYKEYDSSVFNHSKILRNILPYAWDPNVPSESYGGSPLIWHYYAQKAPKNERNINYIVQRSDHLPPENTKLISEEDGVTLYVLNESVWAKHRAIRPPFPAVSPVFSIPRGIIFRSVPLKDGPRIINVLDVIKSLGFDVDTILDKLVVEH